MKIKALHLREFKRFTDLQIKDIPSSARLVVLVGPNGSGKTSLFEAFNFWISPAKDVEFERDYLWKEGSNSSNRWNELYQQITIDFHDATFSLPDLQQKSEAARKAFYFRSAYRHEPDFIVNGFGSSDDILNDSRRPRKLISSETRVSDNYYRMVSTTIREVWSVRPDNPVTAVELRERLVRKIRAAMQRVFEDLTLSNLGDPSTGGTFFFKKGITTDFRYKNLSSGEKAAFDLLLDFIWVLYPDSR